MLNPQASSRAEGGLRNSGKLSDCKGAPLAAGRFPGAPAWGRAGGRHRLRVGAVHLSRYGLCPSRRGVPGRLPLTVERNHLRKASLL